MKNKNNIIIALIIIIILLLSYFLSEKYSQNEGSVVNDSNLVKVANVVTTEHDGIWEVNFENYISLLESKDKYILYIGNMNCGYCDMFTPVVAELITDYDLPVYYFDTANLSSEAESKEFIESIPYLEEEEEWGTPLLLVLENQEVINSNPGYVDRESLFTFLKEDEFISNDEIFVTEDNGFNDININDFESIIDTNELSLIYVGRPTCSHCVVLSPILKKVSQDNSFTVNYLDTDKLDADGFNKLVTSFDFFAAESGWGTPLLMIVQDGQLIIQQMGSQSEENLTLFLKNNGIIEGN